MQVDKNLLYLYELPKDVVSSVKIAAKIKDTTAHEIQEPPQIRRDNNKPFFSAIVKINDQNKFKDIAKAMKYFEIDGKHCRALPYDRELLGANRQAANRSNIFVKNIPKDMNSAQLEQVFTNKLGPDVVKSAKVSINPDYSSRGYGFVHFQTQEIALQVLNSKDQFQPLELFPYAPKDRRELRKTFNNIYAKNFPRTWTDAKLKEIFGKYGTIKSLVLQKKIREGQTEESPFAFICYEDPVDKTAGARAAANAVEQEHDKEYDGVQIYVKEALKKEEREAEKKREQLRFKNSKKRCNLYVKNFPANTTEAELRQYFQQYGEIESVKVFPKEGEALYAFVCYKSPDHAATAKQLVPQQPFNGKTLYVNHYELKEVRKIQQEENRDKADFQNHKKQNITGFSADLLNKPEVFQIIQFIMNQLNRARGFQNNNMGYQNRQQRGPNPNRQFNQQPGNMPKPQMAPQPMPPLAQQPMVQMRPGMPMGIPPQAQMMNIPPEIVQYQALGFKLVPAVLPQNPNYKGQVGEFIYEYVEKIAGEERAPKITGMLIDLPIPEIQGYLVEFTKLQQKVSEANTLLQQQQ